MHLKLLNSSCSCACTNTELYASEGEGHTGRVGPMTESQEKRQRTSQLMLHTC